jgi:hypothetical protein
MHRPSGLGWLAFAFGFLCGACSSGADGGGVDIPRPMGAVSVGPIVLSGGQTVGGPDRNLTAADGPRFSGIGLLSVSNSRCTASLVVPSADLPVDDGPAYLLTAGHCVRAPFPGPDDVLRDLDLAATYSNVLFRYFADSESASTRVNAVTAPFVTMKGIDLAIIELAETRAQLRAAGVVPFVLSDRPTADSEAIAIVGHPNAAPATLTACPFERRLPLILEAVWHAFDAEADECQGIADGSSGSPVFSLATGEVVAVVSTQATPSPNGPLDDCLNNHPCEVTSAGVAYATGTTYTMGVSGLVGCFDPDGTLDLALPGCPLDRGVQMLPSPDNFTLTASATPAPVSVALGANGLTHYRYVFAPAGAVDCRQAGGYGSVIAWADAPTITLTPPSAPGISLLCIQAGTGADPSTGWQDLATPTIVLVKVQAAS